MKKLLQNLEIKDIIRTNAVNLFFQIFQGLLLLTTVDCGEIKNKKTIKKSSKINSSIVKRRRGLVEKGEGSIYHSKLSELLEISRNVVGVSKIYKEWPNYKNL